MNEGTVTMREKPPVPDRLWALTEGAWSGKLTEAETAELEALLIQDSAAREFYFHFFQMDANLRLAMHAEHALAGVRDQIEALVVPATLAPSRRPSRRSRIAWLAAMAAAMLLALGVGLWTMSGGRSRPAPVPQIDNSYGEVVVSSPRGETRPATPGQPLLPGQSLQTGPDESGTRLQLDPSSHLQLAADTVIRLQAGSPGATGSKQVFFAHGTVKAQIASQPGASPFRLTTPHAEIHAQEATFTTTSLGDKTRVELESGKLELIRLADGEALTLEPGQYVLTSTAIEPMASNPLPTQLTEPRRRLDSWAQALAFSADGQSLVGAFHDQIITWKDGKVIDRRKMPSRGGEGSAVFASDGRYLAQARGDGSLHIFDVVGMTERWDHGNAGAVSQMALASGGRWLATHDPSLIRPARLRLWDTQSEKMQTLTAAEQAITAMTFSLDARWLAAGTKDHFFGLWDVETGERLRWVQVQGKAIRALAFAPDGRLIAASSEDGIVTLWDRESWTIRSTVRGHERALPSLSFGPDGRLLAGGTADGNVWIWNTETGKEKMVLKVGTKSIRPLAFSLNGRTLATSGFYLPVMLWDLPQE